MKTLLVLRHAKSSWKHADLPDHDRPLNKRGKRDAPLIGQLLKETELIPGLLVCSTAVRALATADLVVRAAGYEGDMLSLRRLYLAEPSNIIDALRRVGAEPDRLLLIGHNPGLEDLVVLLTGQPEELPTAALAVIELPIDSWNELSTDTRGSLIRVVRPRELSGETAT